jgi:hypothetical protein
MNVLAASSLLDSYSVSSVAFVTYSSSLAGALFQLSFSSSNAYVPNSVTQEIIAACQSRSGSNRIEKEG